MRYFASFGWDFPKCEIVTLYANQSRL